MMKWEYQIKEIHVIDPKYLDDKAVIDFLNQEGRQGWELISVRNVAAFIVYHFKRPLQEPEVDVAD